MKKIILSLLASMLLCAAVQAQTETCSDCCDWCNDDCYDSNVFYAGFFGGANFLQTQKQDGIKYDYQTGYVLSGSLGYLWCYGLRLEAEYAYRRNSLNKVHFFGRSFRIHGHFQSSSYMANLLWDLPLEMWGCQCWRLRPFIGGGIGYDIQRINTHNEGLVFKETKRDFAWQVIAGLEYPLFCNTDISLEYKFHKGGFNHIYNHSLGIGIDCKFGPF